MTRERISTLEEAVRFLRRIGLEVIDIQCGWLLRGADENNVYCELTCATAAELMDCARAEQDKLLRLERTPSTSWPAQSLAFTSVRLPRQSTLQNWHDKRASAARKEVRP
mgnify:CR=1 FL=1